MTHPVADDGASPAVAERDARRSDPLVLCPFLSSADGDWRAAGATREHRCAAVDPPAILSLDKQRRLCLVPEHRSCTTYEAALRALRIPSATAGLARDASTHGDDGHEEERRDPTADDRPERRSRWVLPRTAPVVLDRGGPSVAGVLANRSLTQLALVVLMALAFLVLALARLSADDRGGGGLAPSPAGTPATSTSTSPGSSPLETAPVVASSPAAASPPPSAAPSNASPSPAASSASIAPSPAASPRTYRVVPGDTLSAIAARFGVSVAALEHANAITDPNTLRVGTILVIP